MIVVPNGDDVDYRSVTAEDQEISEFTLRPGDAALLSTVEVFSLDLDVLGQVTPKFRWAARGLLILSGTAIHRGYGRVRKEGTWVPEPGARLFLIVANNGPEAISLRRHDPIAYLQLIQAERGGVEPEEQQNLGFDYLRSRLFDPSHGPLKSGLSYFRTLKDVEASLNGAVADQRDELDSVKQKVDETSAIVDRVQSATNTVVVFGVYLIAVTLLGIVATTLINAIAGLPKGLPGPQGAIVYIVLGLYALSTIAAVIIVAKGINRQK
ncbi:MAG: hypothetical protein ABI662_11115 [Dermatophilaceae bacterium]